MFQNTVVSINLGVLFVGVLIKEPYAFEPVLGPLILEASPFLMNSYPCKSPAICALAPRGHWETALSAALCLPLAIIMLHGCLFDAVALTAGVL